MGNKESRQHPSSEDLLVPVLQPDDLTTPWRQVKCEKDEMLQEVKDFNPSIDVLRILVYGPTGAGKSSFINSVQRVLLGRNAMSALENSTFTGTSFTIKMKIHKVKKARGEHYPLEIVDIMGFESRQGGIQHDDIIKALGGHILDDYIFNPLAAISAENPKYKKEPSLRDQAHCLVCVLPADSISIMEEKVFDLMMDVRKSANLLDIPQVIVMTKVDKACELVKKDLKKIYYSKKIKEKMEVCVGNVGVPLNAIYPVKNYSESITQEPEIDELILTALKDILNFANDHVERELEKGKK